MKLRRFLVTIEELDDTDQAAAGRKAGGKTGGKGRPKADSSGTSCTRANRDDTKRTQQQAAKSTGLSAATLLGWFDQLDERKRRARREAAREDTP